MSDSELNALKRRWKSTGDFQDHAAYLQAAVRAGRADPGKLRLLARARAPETPAIELVLGPVEKKIVRDDERLGEDVLAVSDYDRWVNDASPEQRPQGANTFYDLLYDDWDLLNEDERQTRIQASKVLLNGVSELLHRTMEDGRRRPMSRRRAIFRHELDAQEAALAQVREAIERTKWPDFWTGRLLNVLHAVAYSFRAMQAFGVYRDFPDYVDDMIADGESDSSIEAEVNSDDRFMTLQNWPAEDIFVDRQTRTIYCVPPDGIIWLDFYHFLFKRLLAWLRDEPLPVSPPLRTWI